MQDMEIDESFKRPGSVPFKWEIRPGIARPDHKNTTSPVLSKLRLPPSRIPALSDGPIIRSRSPSLSPSKRHNLFPFSPSHSASKRHGNNRAQISSRAIATTSETVSQGCFTVPSLRRKDDKKVCSGVGMFALPNSTASSPSSFERLLITAEKELAANGIL